jgi:acetyltransferase-like isoleucine patch superfamily enzyme
MNQKQSLGDVFIIGASGFAAEICSWIISSTDHMPSGFVVENGGELISPKEGVACYHEKDLIGATGSAYVAIGNPRNRQLVIEKLKINTDFKYPNLVHHTAIVDSAAIKGNGNLIMPFSVVCPLARIGSFNIINIYGSVGHNAILGDFNTLSPYATLNGNSCCEGLCFLGSHATLGPGACMKTRASLSANSFGRKDIPAGCLAFGVPAKVFKFNDKSKL